MLGFFKKNNIHGQWLPVSELSVGMQIAVPKDGVLEAHQAGLINSRQWMGGHSPSAGGEAWPSLGAGSFGDVLWDEIISIEEDGEEQVWDIEVEGTHNFIGNNIFAHNTYISGNTGIGTSTPTAKLSVFSNISGGGVATFTDANASCTIDPTNSGLSCSSDQNLKKDIVALNATSTLDKLMSLRAVDYHWSGESSAVGTHTGFVAQEVEAVFPEFVSTDTAGRKAVAYGNLIPVMVTAIQQINNKVAVLDSRLTNLEALVASSESSAETGLTFAQIISEFVSQFETIGAKFVDGIAYFKNIFVGKLTVGSTAKPTGITIYDEVTGLPYCLKIQNGATVSLSGQCPEPSLGATNSNGSATSSPAVDSSVPVLTILGNNPATVPVGSTYSDLGATVTDTNADGSVNNNLGIATFINGVEMQSISLDTSTTSVHTILYKATDGAGNVGEGTRTVNVVSAE